MSTIKNVTVVGGGLMGAGIAQVSNRTLSHLYSTSYSNTFCLSAQVCCAFGLNVTVVELSVELAAKSRDKIAKHLHKFARQQFGATNSAAIAEYVSSSLGRLSVTSSLKDGVAAADLIVEAIIETLPAKHDLFARLDAIAPANCVFATNTSSLSVNAIASPLPASRRRNFAGVHFFSPVAMNQIVEIIRCAETTDDTIKRLQHFADTIEKSVLECKDTPGFVVNGLLIPILGTAMRMVEEGVATAANVDKGVRLALMHPLGPLQMADYIGLDVCQYILKGVAERDPASYQGKMLGEMVARGELGIKSGKGFYEYAKSKL